MKITDDSLTNGVSEQAKQSPRLRMNYNFHESLDDFFAIFAPDMQSMEFHHVRVRSVTYDTIATMQILL